MKEKTVEKVIRVLWKETIKKIKKGEMANFQATAEDGSKARVAASLLNKEIGTNYSVSISGNTITVKYE